MTLDNATLRDALTALGELLVDRGETYDIVVIGGGALLLGGHIERPTKDLDVLARIEGDRWLSAQPLPDALRAAVADVGDAFGLARDWLNCGPTSLLAGGLPDGFPERLSIERFDALTVRFASRVDQIAFKLYAAADHWPGPRNRHLQDLKALRPREEELLTSARWCRTHDASEGFRGRQLLPVLQELGVEVADV
jgi:hypothetical protein